MRCYLNKSSARVGDTLTYTVEVSNGTGAEVNIRDAVMQDTIPDGLTFRGNVTVDGYSAVYQYDNGSHTLTVPLDAIAPGQIKMVRFDVLVNSSAYGMTIENTAIASGSNAPDTEDTDDGVIIEDGKADGHAGAKSANKTTARVGDTITYTITLQNSSLATADWTGATVTDVLPDGVSFAGNVQKDGRATTEYSYDSSSRTLTLTPYAIAPDTQVVYTFDVTVDEGMQGKYKIVCGSKCASAAPVQLQSRLNELTAKQTELLDRILEDMDNPDLNARLSELAAEKKTITEQLQELEQNMARDQHREARMEQMQKWLSEFQLKLPEYDDVFVRHTVGRVIAVDAETIRVRIRDTDVEIEQKLEAQ